MTPDQIHQVATEIFAGIGLILGNGHLRKRATRKHLESEDSLVSVLTAKTDLVCVEMEKARNAIARLEVKMDARAVAEEKTDRELENVRIEMHALSGRVDAANALYTEMLQKARERAAVLEAKPIEKSGGLQVVKKKEET